MMIDPKTVETVEGAVNVVAPVVISFIPGAAAAAPFIKLALPALETAFNAIALNNGGDLSGALQELVQHLTPGQPNSPILGPVPTQDPSAQGSG